MNAEELDEIREGYWGRAGSAQELMVRKLFVHIDEQAKQIVAANQRYSDLQQICDDQDKQIATLKAALHKERNRYLVDFIHEYDDILDCGPEAKEQLARELPEIDWEDKQ